MDTLLCEGDFALNRCGVPVMITGSEEIIQRCMIRLTVRRGSFKCDTKLGSRLNTLPRAAPDVIKELAEQYISEALEDMPYVGVRDVECRYNPQDDSVTVTVTIDLREQSYSLEVKI